MLSSARSSSVSWPSRSRRSSQMLKNQRSKTPPTIRNGTSEKPNGVISLPPIVGASIGCSQPHLLLWRIPKTIRPRPAAESAAPT